MKTLLSALLALCLSSAALSGAGGQVVGSQIPAPELDKGFLKLGFDRLAGFKFDTPQYDPLVDPKAAPPTGDEQIPPMVKSWSGKKAVITGFMLPTKMENGRAVEFLLMANQMACCYGTVPNTNDWVIVKSKEGVAVVQDVPIAFRGTFKVGAVFENGYMTGIYSLDSEGPGEIKD